MGVHVCPQADLVQRLTAALDTAVPGSAAEGPAGEERAAAKGSAAAPKEEGGADVAPGTAGLGHIATAEVLSCLPTLKSLPFAVGPAN